MSQYPALGFHFRAEFLDTSGKRAFDEISFQEISGLNVEIGVEELSEGGVNNYSHRLPGKVKYGNLVLKRGMPLAMEGTKLKSPLQADASGLVDWAIKSIEQYEFKPMNVDVYLLNEKNDPMMAWHFYRVWPVKLVTTDLKAQDNAIVIESFELAYQRFTRRKA